MNIYIGCLIVGVIFAITPIIKKQIMKDFTKDEFTLYNTLLFILIMFIMSRFRNGLELKNLKTHKYFSYGFLLLSAILGFSYVNILNDMLKEYSPDNVMLNIKAVETILLFIFACILSSGFTFKKLGGVLFILLGSYLYQ
tara:strand:- start:1918 stop:2337 length:420 start_codon:yes stop_codon:yes gene_type:complete